MLARVVQQRVAAVRPRRLGQAMTIGWLQRSSASIRTRLSYDLE
jgi:hypothetical protein